MRFVLKGQAAFLGESDVSAAPTGGATHKHIVQCSKHQLTQSSSNKVPLHRANRILAPYQSKPYRATRAIVPTSRTIVPRQSYPCSVPVVPLHRTSRTLAPYQSYRSTVPVVPLYRASRTLVPYQSCPCTAPIVPLYRTGRTLAPYQSYPCTVPVVPLYRTSRTLVP